METIEEIQVNTSVKKRSVNVAADNKHENNFLKFWKQHAIDFENTRYGWMAILITFQSCLGAAACMFILKNGGNTFELSTCAALSMGSNALFIGLASPKVCLIGFYISVVLNTIFLLLNL